jgi:hypothetical protein
LGDIASSQGKSLGQISEAIRDATSGEFERLKEFGSRASSSGKQVELSFRGITRRLPKHLKLFRLQSLSLGNCKAFTAALNQISVDDAIGCFVHRGLFN